QRAGQQAGQSLLELRRPHYYTSSRSPLGRCAVSLSEPVMSDSASVQLQRCLDRLRQGDAAARNDLLSSACDRLQGLTRKMLNDARGVRRWEQTDDVLQNALLRLSRALEAVTPATARDFYRLAAAQIRRELIDLARHYYGPQGAGAHHASEGPR